MQGDVSFELLPPFGSALEPEHLDAFHAAGLVLQHAFPNITSDVSRLH